MYWIFIVALGLASAEGYLSAQELPLRTEPSQVFTSQWNFTEVQVMGSTAFSEEDFAPVIAPYLHREITPEALRELGRQLTEVYKSAGYPTSEVVLPPQEIVGGRVVYQAIEGRLTELEIQGLRHIRESYIRERIELAASPPLSAPKLEEALVLLQQTPLIEKLEANLSPGLVMGESSLAVTVTEAPRWQLGIRADNAENPAIGEWGLGFSARNHNVFGWGDRLELEYKFTVDDGLDKFFASYTVPVNARDGTLRLSYRDDDTRIVEAPLLEAGLVTNSSTVSVGFQQPLWKSPDNEFILGGSLELRESETFIFETVPLPAFNGSNRLNLSISRFWQTFLARSAHSSLGIWSQFSFGLPIFDATSQSEFLNTEFFDWQGQVQYAAQLGGDWIFLTRLQGKWTPDSLPVIEQFAIGGGSTVRGYRQNTRSGDSGLTFSAEFRRPFWQDADWGTGTLYTFFDFGVIWNNQLPTTYPNSLASVGVGLEWEMEEWFLFGFNYGLRLIEDPTLGRKTLQDEGINLLLQLKTTF